MTYSIAAGNVSMTQDERNEVKLEGLEQALEIVRQYQNNNWRRLRVNEVCADLKQLLSEEFERLSHGMPSFVQFHRKLRG